MFFLSRAWDLTLPLAPSPVYRLSVDLLHDQPAASLRTLLLTYPALESPCLTDPAHWSSSLTSDGATSLSLSFLPTTWILTESPTSPWRKPAWIGPPLYHQTTHQVHQPSNCFLFWCLLLGLKTPTYNSLHQSNELFSEFSISVYLQKFSLAFIVYQRDAPEQWWRYG